MNDRAIENHMLRPRPAMPKRPNPTAEEIEEQALECVRSEFWDDLPEPVAHAMRFLMGCCDQDSTVAGNAIVAGAARAVLVAAVNDEILRIRGRL